MFDFRFLNVTPIQTTRACLHLLVLLPVTLSSVAFALDPALLEATHNPDSGDIRTDPMPAPDSAERPEGRWRRAPAVQEDPLDPEQQAMIEQLEALGYLSGTVSALAGAVGVTVYERDKTVQGLNFYTSGHFPGALLMDMEGNVLHRWQRGYRDIWSEEDKPGNAPGMEHWRRAFVYPNGDVLAIFEGSGIIKVDKDSNVIWANELRAHHDLEVMPNGDIYVLSRQAHVVPRVNPYQPVLEDFVSILAPDGREKRRVSLLECLENSPYHHILARAKKRGDLFHTNSLRVLDDAIEACLPAFRSGRILTSFLVMNTVAVVDLDTKSAVWAWSGSFRRQHDPKILPSGTMLIFDNRGGRPHSRVLEVDPATRKTVWSYTGTAEAPFHSASCGSAERLRNGNTLIVESDAGRVLEVTSAGLIVWEYRSPHRAGEDNSLVATLFDLARLDPDYFDGEFTAGLSLPQQLE